MAEPQQQLAPGNIQRAARQAGQEPAAQPGQILNPQDPNQVGKTRISQADIKASEAADAARQNQRAKNLPSSANLPAGQEKRASRGLAAAQKSGTSTNLAQRMPMAEKPKDNQLKTGQENTAARDLNRGKKQSARNRPKQNTRNIRGKIQQAKAKMEEAKDQFNTAGQQITSEVLRQSWINLVSSYGLTILYINLHFFAKYFAGFKFFSDFGSEWMKKLGKAGQIPGANRVASSGLKWLEIIALFVIDFLILILLLLSIVISILPIIIILVFFGTIVLSILKLFG